MRNSNKKILIICLIVVCIFLYAFISYQNTKINILKTKENYLNDKYKNIENEKTSKETELKTVNSNCFIESSARKNGYIMPEDVYFDFENND